jgi:flagellin-like protein
MDKEMKMNDEAVSPVIATILMVAITVVLAGVLYVWANSLASDQPDVGTRNNFSASDADDAIGGAADDTLLRVGWTNAQDDLNWAFVTFTLEKGDQTFKCTTKTDAQCLFDQQGDDPTKWEHDEIIYVTEGSANICGTSDGSETSCKLSVTVSYNGIMVAGTPIVTVA